MEALLWLDVPLLVFGIGAVFTAGWLKFGSNRAGSPRRRLQPLTVVLVVGGLASLSAAGLDHALAVWDRSQRPLAVEPDPLFEVGTLAPDFALPSLEGRSYRLSDFRGRKPVLLTLSSFG